MLAEPILMPLGSSQRIVVTSADGTARRRLPRAQIVGAQAEVVRFGLYGQFTVNTAVPYSSDALPTILKGDRVEFYYQGVLRYRGWIEERACVEGEPDTLALVGYGLYFLMGQQRCFGRYAYAGSGVDVADAFAEIARDATLSRNQTAPSALGRQGLPLYGALLADKIGTTTTFVDAYNKLFSAVANDLVQSQAGNLAFWGGDVDAYGQDRLRVGPLAATTFPPTHTVRVPAQRTQAAEGEDQAGDLKNRILMSGGAAALSPAGNRASHRCSVNLPLLQ